MTTQAKPHRRLPDEATVYLRVWTAQQCLACGAKFEYLRRFTVYRRETEFNATAADVEAEYRKYGNDFSDPCPCPQCGVVQPDMEGAEKSARHFNVTLLGFLIVAVAAIATGIGLLPLDIGTLVTSGLVLLVLVAQLIVGLKNPNRDLQKNRKDAERRVAKGDLQLVQPGDRTSAGDDPLAVSWMNSGRYLMVGTLCLLAAAAVFNLPGQLSWPLMPLQAVAMLLMLGAGYNFATRAYYPIKRAFPHEVLSVESVVIEDETVPEDFRTK